MKHGRGSEGETAVHEHVHGTDVHEHKHETDVHVDMPVHVLVHEDRGHR